MGFKSPPKAPAPVVINPGASAAAQAKYNKDAALDTRALNMYDQYTPEGTVKYEQRLDDAGNQVSVNDIPQYDIKQTLTPENKILYDDAMASKKQYSDIATTQLGDVKSSLSSPFTLSSFGDAPVVNEATRQATRDSILARLRPEQERDRAALETSLANRGFTVGSAGYNTAIDELNRARNDLYLGADVQSGNEMSRLYGLQTDARNRAIQEALMTRNQPLSELNTLLTGSAPTTPSFVNAPTGQIAAPDYLGANVAAAGQRNAANMNNYNIASRNASASNSGLFDLLGTGAQAAFRFSDRRLKKQIKKIGEMANGLGVYSYKYIWGEDGVGVMADEVKKIIPHAVKKHSSGYDMVNYGALNG
tara:strand:- start:2860 stop:3948 length:1089 start_codon:yes stop_codon:yes gene_type:complete